MGLALWLGLCTVLAFLAFLLPAHQAQGCWPSSTQDSERPGMRRVFELKIHGCGQALRRESVLPALAGSVYEHRRPVRPAGVRAPVVTAAVFQSYAAFSRSPRGDQIANTSPVRPRPVGWSSRRSRSTSTIPPRRTVLVDRAPAPVRSRGVSRATRSSSINVRVQPVHHNPRTEGPGRSEVRRTRARPRPVQLEVRVIDISPTPLGQSCHDFYKSEPLRLTRLDGRRC